MEMQSNLSPYIHLEEIERYFETFIQSATKKDFWLELNGNPVSWDIPLGTVVSLYAEDSGQEVPVTFIFHKRNCPSSILKLENIAQIKSRFLDSLKDVKIKK